MENTSAEKLKEEGIGKRRRLCGVCFWSTLFLSLTFSLFTRYRRNPIAKAQRKIPNSVSARGFRWLRFLPYLASDSSSICPWSDFPFLVLFFRFDPMEKRRWLLWNSGGKLFFGWLIGLDCVEDKEDDWNRIRVPDPDDWLQFVGILGESWSMMQNRSPPKHRHDGTSPLPLGMDWSPPPRKWVGFRFWFCGFICLEFDCENSLYMFSVFFGVFLVDWPNGFHWLCRIYLSACWIMGVWIISKYCLCSRSHWFIFLSLKSTFYLSLKHTIFTLGYF